MKVIIHRGTHQIGGIATEIKTDKSRIIIDMGEELSLDPDFVPKDISIPGVTDTNGNCDAVLFTHYHGDHVGQLKNIRDGIPIYMGGLAKDVLLATSRKESKETIQKIEKSSCFEPGKSIKFGDITVTPFGIDHSACDSYMFLIEADGKRILYTGDFRLHGFRGKGIPKILDKYIQKVDVLITEGTTISREGFKPITERELQQKVKQYLEEYKYVFVYCASTNLERICALAKAVPRGKYFLCDKYQNDLLDLLDKNWRHYSELYRNIKRTVYGDNIIEKCKQRGFLMIVRDNANFRNIIKNFEKEKSIMLYSMWDGYRTNPGSTIPEFLKLAGKWETLHTSGHTSVEGIKMLIEKTKPSTIIPMHTDVPNQMSKLFQNENIVVLNDGQEFEI